MIPIKTSEQIAVMKEGGRRLSWVFTQILREVKPGVSLKELEKLASKLIREQKGIPSFKTVKNYHWATCININEGVVHGIPDSYELKAGDLVSLDMGMIFGGFHTDMARTFQVRTQNLKLETQNLRFLEAGWAALMKATTVARAGNRVGHISQAMEDEIKKAGFSPVRELTGHGVGRRLHEEPEIPCFLRQPVEKTLLLKPRMVLAVEVIYTQGRPELVLAENGWTLRTNDGKLAGLFENSLVITEGPPLVLTSLKKSRLAGLNLIGLVE